MPIAADVRASLTREAIVRYFGLETRGTREGWWRSRTCPACGKRWRDLGGSGFCLGTRGWTCKACGASGDLIDLLARLAGLDPRADFPRVLALGAQVSGAMSDQFAGHGAARAGLKRIGRPDRDAERAARAVQRAQARARTPRLWCHILPDHSVGRDYLGRRALDVDLLIVRGAVRFQPRGWRPGDPPGDPTVVLYDWDGACLNLVRRRVAGDEPKAPGLRGAPTDGTLIGRLPEVHDGADVVLAEGVTDSLTAVLAWPRAVVLGAHGAGMLAKIAAAAAPAVRAASGRLLIVPHADQVGQDAAVAAAAHALDAGLSIGRDLDVLELGGLDLNEAWCAGWRP